MAMAGPLAWVAMDNWVRGVPAVTVALAAHRLASILWLAMAATAVMVRRAALAQPVPVARVARVVQVVVLRVAQHNSEQLAVTVVPVVPVVHQRLVAQVPVA